MEDFKFLSNAGEPEAAVALVVNGFGQILAFKHLETDLISLPRQQRDEGEVIRDAAVRAFADIGVKVAKMVPVFAMKEQSSFVTTFYAVETQSSVSAVSAFSKKENYVLTWVDIRDLCDSKQCPQSEYNTPLFRALFSTFQTVAG